MKARLNLPFLFALAMASVGGYALYASLHWPFRTALFPRVIAIPLLLLATVEMCWSLFGAEEKREGHAIDFELTTDISSEVALSRTIAIFCWIFGFLALILLVGFPFAVPLFVFLYLKVAGGEGWLLTLSLTVLSWLFMEGLFNRLLHLPFAQGWVFSLWQ